MATVAEGIIAGEESRDEKLPLIAGEDNSRSPEIRSSRSSKIATLVVPGDREPQSSEITSLVAGKEKQRRWKQKKGDLGDIGVDLAFVKKN